MLQERWAIAHLSFLALHKGYRAFIISVSTMIYYSEKKSRIMHLLHKLFRIDFLKQNM